MHNIKMNFGIIYRICKEIFDKKADRQGNFQFDPRKPVLSDVQEGALSCLMGGLSIDSENLLWSKLKTDFHDYLRNSFVVHTSIADEIRCVIALSRFGKK